jgi:hypothetical protein
MSDASALQLVVQLGSFGLLAYSIVYVIRVVIPRVVEAFERQAVKFEAMHEKQEERHARELDKRDEVSERIAAALDRVTDRLTKLEARTDQYHPLPHTANGRA